MAVIQWSDAGETLAIAPLGGGEPRPLIQSVHWADWAPDGNSLAILRGRNPRARLEFPVGNLLYEPAGGRIRVSPQGDHVVFTDAGRGLAVVDRKKTKTVLVEDANNYAWSPDGREVWFTRISDGSTHLYAVTLAGRERLLASLPGDFALHHVSRQGRVLFERGFEPWQVVGRFPGDEAEHGYNWLDATVALDLSADGKTLLFIEKEPAWKNAMSYVRKTDGSPAVPLTEGFCRPLSPDGRWAICRSELLARDLRLVSTSGETRNLPSSGLEFEMRAGFDWHPDGKGIVFTANAPGRPSRVYVQSIDGSAPVPVTPEGVEMVFLAKAVSPDGKFVVAFQGETAALYPLKGGPALPIPGLVAGDLPMQWSADGGSLYLQREDEPGSIWRIETGTGKRRLFKEIRPSDPGLGPGGRWLWSLLITPDGQSYVATYSGWLADLFVLDGLK